MSLGWGKVPKEAWDGIKVGPGQDKVDPGDYEVVPKKLRHIEPGDSGVGVFIVQTETTVEGNQVQWANKQLDYRINYDPDPQEKGRKEMNRISLEKAKALVVAANIEEVYDAEGDVSIPDTLEAICAAQPRIVVYVSHSSKDGNEYQDCGNPRPAVQ